MDAFIHAIETRVPGNAYRQDYAAERMRGWLAEPRARRLASAIYARSGIETRYSVLSDFQPGGEPELFPEGADGRLQEPSTFARNRAFARHAGPLAVDTARSLLHRAAMPANRITHVVTVSCTGFYNPGPDYDLVRGLGLSESVERYHLGFMGCYAAFPALKMARQICLADPGAVVLVVCIELCSLHLQVGSEPDQLLANALFADGVAAALVSAEVPAAGAPALALDRFHSALIPEGAGDMAWEIGDRGFNIRLSTYVPDLIGANVAGIVADVLGDSAAPDDIDVWAVHPGGRSILDRVEEALAFRPGQIAASREVLRRYGNMSSATVLFVLRELLESASAKPQRICAMAFGPGLTVECSLMELLRPSESALRKEGLHAPVSV